MDKLKKYDKILRGLLVEYAKVNYANLNAQNEVIIDKENHHYQLVTIGWEGLKRVHTCTLHFDIINGKIWIQNDQTDFGIANELLEKGIPKSDIVLAYHVPSMREELGFPVS